MSSSAVVLGAALPVIYLASAVGVGRMLRRERLNPSSYTRGAHIPDDAALDAAELREQGRLRSQTEWRQWQPEVVAGASEAAEIQAAQMAEAAKRNALFHP